MFRDLLEYLKELLKKVVTSRLFAISLVFVLMYGTLVARLFSLQIVHGEEYQDEYMEMYAKVFDRYPWVVGELAWNFADFQTGQGIMRVGGNRKGVFTRERQPKQTAHLLRKRWETK